jgi:hypothetical protein
MLVAYHFLRNSLQSVENQNEIDDLAFAAQGLPTG